MHACLVIRASAWKTSLSALGVLVRFCGLQTLCRCSCARGWGGKWAGVQGGGVAGGGIFSCCSEIPRYTLGYTAMHYKDSPPCTFSLCSEHEAVLQASHQGVNVLSQPKCHVYPLPMSQHIRLTVRCVMCRCTEYASEAENA